MNEESTLKRLISSRQKIERRVEPLVPEIPPEPVRQKQSPPKGTSFLISEPTFPLIAQISAKEGVSRSALVEALFLSLANEPDRLRWLVELAKEIHQQRQGDGVRRRAESIRRKYLD